MKDFYSEIFINAPIQKVWKAFMAPNEFFMKFSGPYEGKETIHIYGKILEYEEHKLLAYTDHPGPIFNVNHAKLQSRVKVTFDTIGQSTKLTLTNDQFSENNPMQEKSDLWYLILSNLKSYVETGELLNLE